MTDDSDVPTEYHEYLEFVESNDDYVVAEVFNNNYIPISELEALVDEWDTERERCRTAGNAESEVAYETCTQELRNLIQEYQGESNE